MVTEFLADRKATGRAFQRCVQLPQEVEVDALPADRLSQPPPLARRLEVGDRSSAMLESVTEPGDPHRLLAEDVMRFPAGRRVAGVLRLLDGALGARHRPLVVAEVAVRMRKLEEPLPGKP